MTTEPVQSESELDALLSSPSPRLIDTMRRLEGDIMILGVAGKMGVTLAMAAKRAIDSAGVRKQVTGVSRFSDPKTRASLEEAGIATIACDLIDRDAVSRLPHTQNVVFMAGRKFGTQGDEGLTWSSNVLIPANVGEHFSTSRIVAFSTGCVYPLASPESGGCTEDDPPAPIGEYSQSCLGRERVFDYYSKHKGTPVCLLRLNYAIDLRYGVLHDIGQQIVKGRPIDVSMGYFNCIWQGDANSQALLALEHCDSPAKILNITGPETIAVRSMAQELASELGTKSTFTGEESSTAYLNNAAKAHRLFGAPSVSLAQMVEWTAHWIKMGGSSLGRSTHFEVRDGNF